MLCIGKLEFCSQRITLKYHTKKPSVLLQCLQIARKLDVKLALYLKFVISIDQGDSH